MNIGVRILKALFPNDEKERVSLRRQLQYAEAQAEDMNRTLVLNHDDITEMISKHRAKHQQPEPDRKVNGNGAHG